VLSILLNSATIEEETDMEIEIDKEIRATGIGNLFGSLASGFVGYASAQKTLLCHGMGGQNMAGAFLPPTSNPAAALSHRASHATAM
jgi:MFS superfamily sulfate permease-like transporter